MKFSKLINFSFLFAGCPKDYSTKGGMGAALMSTPDRAVAILTSLVKNLRIPVSAKIRCYSDTQKTVDFAKRLEATGISALAIHGRLKVISVMIKLKFF